MEKNIEQEAENNALYMYYKMAERLNDDAIETLNSRSYSWTCCSDFRHRYMELKELLANLYGTKKYGKDIALPGIDVPMLPDEEGLRGMLSSVIMSTGQMMAMIEGSMGSFDKELHHAKQETVRLKEKIIEMKKELKKVKPVIPGEIISKIPSQLSKTISSLNFNYANTQWDATAMLTRKLISDAIDIKFRMIQKPDRLIDKNTGKEFDLPKKINICGSEHLISGNIVNKLGNSKLIQDAVIHTPKVQATPVEVEHMVTLARIFLEELFS